MEIIYNKQKVQNLLQSLHSLTGVSFCFYDAKFNVIEYSRKRKTNDNYCETIQSNPKTCKDCKLSDEIHFSLSQNNDQQYYIYTCHAGLIEIIVPFFQNNIKIGSLVIGKLRDKEMIYSKPEYVKKYIKSKKLDNQLFKDYTQYPCLSHDEIQSLIDIVCSCFQYIINEQLIKLNQENTFNDILKYLDDNLDKHITINMLCKEFQLNKNSLYKIFKSNTEQTVLEYITHHKINHAAHLLTSTNLSIVKIAYSVGFAEYNYFISLFKKIMHKSPLKYRKEFAYNNTSYISK